MNARIAKLLGCAIALFLCVFSGAPNARLMAQKQAAVEKPWRELVSSEGHFRVLLPDSPNETFLPFNAQIIHSEVRIFAVQRPEAVYAVLFGNYPNEERDPESIREHFESSRDRMLAEGRLVLLSEKDISSANTPAREYVFDEGAWVIRTRLYYSKGVLYETIFATPGLTRMPPALVQYYDGLAAKFLNSFKIGA